MPSFLHSYLDAIDAQLLTYLDPDGQMDAEVVRRLLHYTQMLLSGDLKPNQVEEDWADWFTLIGTYVAADGHDELALGR